MAQNGQFGLSVRVLGYLALQPDQMHTSAEIAAALGTSPVMVRRVFAALHEAGFTVQRKGPQGGAKLKVAAKQIGLGDVYAAVGGGWPSMGNKELDAALQRVQGDAVKAMNDTSVAAIVKKLRKR